MCAGSRPRRQTHHHPITLICRFRICRIGRTRRNLYTKNLDSVGQMERPQQSSVHQRYLVSGRMNKPRGDIQHQQKGIRLPNQRQRRSHFHPQPLCPSGIQTRGSRNNWSEDLQALWRSQAHPSHPTGKLWADDTSRKNDHGAELGCSMESCGPCQIIIQQDWGLLFPISQRKASLHIWTYDWKGPNRCTLYRVILHVNHAMARFHLMTTRHGHISKRVLHRPRKSNSNPLQWDVIYTIVQPTPSQASMMILLGLSPRAW